MVSSSKGFSLAEVVIAVALVGGVLSMIMGAVVILDRAVANERTVAFAPPSGSVADWAYQDSGSFPGFSIAPSRLSDAKAQSLWRQIHELYEQSVSIGAINAYVIVDMTTAAPPPTFVGNQGYLSKPNYYPLNKNQLTDLYTSTPVNNDPANGPNDPRNSLWAVLRLRFANQSPFTFKVWTGSNCGGIDGPTLRTSTIFFLGSENRLLGMLRARAWQFDANSGNATEKNNPYRYYEVNLTRFRWSSVVADNGVDQSWSLLDTGGSAVSDVVQDFSYRFVEDRRFPQNLIFPPTLSQSIDWAGDLNGGLPKTGTLDIGTDGTPRNTFIRFAQGGETYPTALVSGAWDNNTDPKVSRLQVSLVPRNNVGGGDNLLYNSITNITAPLGAPVDEWHLILPDPSLSQAEDRAALRNSQGAGFNATLDKGFRRQGKYGCVLSVYP